MTRYDQIFLQLVVSYSYDIYTNYNTIRIILVIF